MSNKSGKATSEKDAASTNTKTTEDRTIEVLEEISNKLSILPQILTAIEKQTKLIKLSQKDNQQNTTNETTMNEMTKALTKLNENIPNITQDEAQNDVTTNKNTSIYFEEEAMKVKASIANYWEIKLEKRNDCYWKAIRNEGFHRMYKKWIESEPIIVPKSFQKLNYFNERENQKNVRAKLAKHEFEAHVELLELRASQNSERYEALDQDMKEFIGKKCSGQTRKVLLEIWRENNFCNEESSNRRWTKTENWLNRYEEDFLSRPNDKNPFFKDEDEIPEPRQNYPPRNTRTPRQTYTAENHLTGQHRQTNTGANIQQTWDPKPLPQRERHTRFDRRNTPFRNEQHYPNKYGNKQQREKPIVITEDNSDNEDIFLEGTASTETLT